METKGGFKMISSGQLVEINGGSFAYDLGRAIRFHGMVYIRGVTGAVLDWVVVDAINEALA